MKRRNTKRHTMWNSCTLFIVSIDSTHLSRAYLINKVCLINAELLLNSLLVFYINLGHTFSSKFKWHLQISLNFYFYFKDKITFIGLAPDWSNCCQFGRRKED